MEKEQWTIKRALEWTRGFLADKGCDNAKASAEWLIGDVARLSRLDVYINLDRPLSSDELSLLHDHVKRRAMGEPLQYISGKAPFRHIVLKVRQGVLIPRPETEVLVSELLMRLPQPERMRAADSSINEYGEPLEAIEHGFEPQRIKVADLCTGSGCIACSLAYEHPDIDVVATDISPEAVSLACENAEALGLSDRVSVVECDLGSGIDSGFAGCLDAVISNPPYVPAHLIDALPSEVAGFEPHLALDGGPDGLDVFRRIAEWSVSALKPSGILAVELHEDSLMPAAEFVGSLGFEDARIVDDLAGKPRVLVAFAPACSEDGHGTDPVGS